MELLVVVGIVALVAALSMPVMVKAYNVSKEAACVSNLRQIGQAHASSTVDFKRKFPAASSPRRHDDAIWTLNLLGPQGSHREGRNIPAEDRVLRTYLSGSDEVAVCPLDRGLVDWGIPSAASRWGTSYAMMNNDSNRFERRVERNGIWSLEGFGLLDVTSPATKATMTDVIQLRNLAAGEQNAWHGVQDGHLRSGMVFVDGHAEVLRLKVEPANPRPQFTRDRRFIEAMAKTDPYH